jgi:hypothetical protein
VPGDGFNLGATGLSKEWPKFNRAIAQGDWAKGQSDIEVGSCRALLALNGPRETVVQELSDESRWAFIPSVVGLAYVPLAPRWYLRPGLRLGYAGLDQAQFSHGARLEEHDLPTSAELSIQYDAWLVPALGIGAGLNRREIDFVGRGIVQDSSAIDRTEWSARALPPTRQRTPPAPRRSRRTPR